MTTIKLTPAMIEWCRYVATDVRHARLVRRTHPDYPEHKHYRTEGWPRPLKPSWAMADKLLAAGLIRWRPYGKDQHIATLTAAGRVAANTGVKKEAPPLTCWPFPVSTVYPKEAPA